MQNYFLPTGYVTRRHPLSFDDHATEAEWQPGAYAAAFELAERIRPASVLDIGCGNARKLRRFHAAGFSVFGADILKTAEQFARERWLRVFAVDLERSPIVLPTPPRRLIICCDVVEHLVAPGHLLLYLSQEVQDGAAVVISTPDRALAGCAPLGPPNNQAHVREWTLAEFRQVCEFYGLEGGAWSHTQTVSTAPECSTITGVFC